MIELHPLVQQVDPSPEQRPAVTARGRDVVLTAGAGTGKTRTLVARYLGLLAEGICVRRLVAITFTQKAAREMRNRVREELRQYLRRSDLDERESQFWQKRYIALDGARISTIHSLCSEILRSHPERLDVDPGFDVLSEGAMALLKQRALEGALAWAAEDAKAAAVFGYLTERQLAKALRTLLENRLTASEVLARLPKDLLVHWRGALARASRQAWLRLKKEAAWREAWATLVEAQPLDADDKMAIQRERVLAAVTKAESSADGWDPALLEPLGTINRSGGKQAAWPGGKKELRDVKNALGVLQALWKAYGGSVLLCLNAADEALAMALPPLIACYRRAMDLYEEAKRARLALDYDDLERSALKLLSHDEVRRAWQARVDAVLVDEFQDTNERQRAIVRYLCAAPGQLFVVGDAKQSIYRFRGADVVVFRDERQRIEREGLAHSLETTYRAHPTLLATLNALLAPVLGEADDPARPWVEPFERLAAVPREPLLVGADAYVELHVALGTKAEGALDRAADAVVERLVELVEGAASPFGYGDVAILCRASSAFESYENALERAGVPFLTVAGKGFYTRPEVRSLLAMLRASWDPNDDAALIGMLRSPAIGLSDLALYRLSRGKRGPYARVSWWQYLRSGQAPTLGREQETLNRALGLLERWRLLAGRKHVADLLQRILLDTHYQAALLAAGQRRAAHNVAKLLADAQAADLVGVGEFLDYVTNLRAVGAREGEARPTAEGVVQLMTVHAAKGLEFPVVVLGDLAYAGRGPSGLLLDSEMGPVVKLEGFPIEPAVYALAKARESDQIDAEDRRLLYVAATRAQELLLLNGTLPVTNNGKPSLTGWLSELAGEENLGLATLDLTEATEAERTELALRAGEEPVACTLYGAAWKPKLTTHISREVRRQEMPDLAMLQPVALGEDVVDEAVKEREADPPRRVWQVVPDPGAHHAPARLVGTLVHEALADGRALDAAVDAWARARASSLGLTDRGRLAHATRRSRELVRRFRAHPLFAELQRARRVFHEVPYTLVVEGVVDRGAMDVLYEADDGWHILDIKTDRLESTQELHTAIVREGYDQQMRRYARAARELLGATPTCRLVFLDCDRSVVVVSVSLVDD